MEMGWIFWGDFGVGVDGWMVLEIEGWNAIEMELLLVGLDRLGIVLRIFNRRRIDGGHMFVVQCGEAGREDRDCSY